MKHTLYIFLLMAINSMSAQNILHGTVVEKTTESPIVFANIYFQQLDKGSSTDENGHFTITNIPNGTYNIIVSYVGYETLSKTINFPYNGKLRLALLPSAIEMEEVIISTPFHKLQSENVMKVEQEKVVDLKAKGAITLAEGITNIAGVESVTTGLSIGKPVIRGLSANRVLVYAQGVRLENQQFGGEHGLGLSDSGIESVEVIKGPASLLYGSDALGGVLYLNPERFAAFNTSKGNISASYFSNTHGFNTSAGVKTSDNVFKFLFRGSLSEHSDYKTNAYRVTNTRFREQDFKAGIGYQITNFKSEIRYNVNHSKLGIPEELDIQNTNKTPLIPFQDITNHIISSKSTVFLNNSSIDVNLGLLYNDRKEFAENAFDPDLHLKLKTFNYDLKYHIPKIGKFETIVGLQGMSQSNTNYGPEELIPDATTNDFGILAVSHIHFNKADVQLGARFDHRMLNIQAESNKQFNSFNGSAGIKTNIFNQVTARLNLATGFRAPNLAELTSDGVHEGTNRYEVGNINLSNEQNFQSDLALEYKNEHVEFFINGFYNKINNYIFLSPTGNNIDSNPVFNYIQDDAKLYGGEIGFHLHPHPLDWLHFESSFETVTGKQNNNMYLPLIPANSLSNTARVEFETSWIKKCYTFIKLKTTFRQHKVSTFETNTESYNLLSAGFGGSLSIFNNELQATISGNNLTNKTYINHLSRLKPDGIFNMGRNINLSISYKL